jgi:hypothetical protein
LREVESPILPDERREEEGWDLFGRLFLYHLELKVGKYDIITWLLSLVG